MFRVLPTLALLSTALLGAVLPSPALAESALVARIEGGIGPASRDFVDRAIEEAEARGAAIVVLEMDTPGGLDSSMRDIIQSILASPVPVATYVSPEGARAASAGTYILYASHVAAMAPATNLGAATPVAIGGGSPAPAPTPENGAGEDAGDETAAEDGGAGEARPEPGSATERKAVNDAVAYIRSLAEKRGRNAEWAERAVREAASLSASEAVELGVVDFVATDLADLLRQADGRTVEVAGQQRELETAGLMVERIEPDWRTRLLAVITDPTVAYLLMLVGIYGLIFEGYNPGAFVPGIVGAICLLLALYAFQILSVNYAGLGLIILGMLLMIGETLVPSFGALGLGGIAAFVIGSVILMDSDVPGFGISLQLILSIATTGALLMMALVVVAVRIRYRPVVSGSEELPGKRAEALESFEHEGAVWVHGERWQARTRTPVVKGQQLAVTGIQGLTLEVSPLDETDSRDELSVDTGRSGA